MIQVWVWWLIWLNCHSSTALPSLRTRKIAISQEDDNLAALKDDADTLEGLPARKRRNAETSGCKFPFIYKDISHSECTTVDDSNGQLWCSTQTDQDDKHVKGNWRHCRNFEGITVSSSSILNEDFSGRSVGVDLIEDDGKLCGVPVSRLFQGRGLMDDFVVEEHKNLAKEGEYPWQVAVLSRNLEYRCGGVIVGKRHVITVAHCVADISAGDIVVRVGDFDLSSDDEEYPSYDIAVRWIKVFPGFIEAKLRDDLALLEVKFNLYRLANVAPACLPTPGTSSDVEDCKVPGWGQFVTSVADMGSHTFTYQMMVAGFRIISRDVCQSAFRGSRKVGAFFKLQKGNICAVGNEGGDACNGDGGSGLICPNNLQQYVVEGLVSWGLGCGLGHPGAYVDVRHYLDWIIEEMDSPGPQPAHSSQATSTSAEVVASSQASTRTPRPVPSSQGSTRSPRPVATSQVPTLSARTVTESPTPTSSKALVVTSVPLATSEQVPQIITYTGVDTGSESSTILSNLPLQPQSELINLHPRPTNVNPQGPVQPTLLSYYTPSAEVETTDTLEVSISAATLDPLTPESNKRFIPPSPGGPSTTLGTLKVFTPSATTITRFVTSVKTTTTKQDQFTFTVTTTIIPILVTAVKPTITPIRGLPVTPESSLPFVPPKPEVPSSTTGQQLPSTLPLFGHLLPDSIKTHQQEGQLPSRPGTHKLNNMPVPPPGPGANNGQGFNPSSSDQDFGFDPFKPDQGFGFDPFISVQGFDPFSPGSGSSHGSHGSGSGALPSGPDSYYGSPGSGGGTRPGPGTGPGILPPGPDSYYGPPGTGAGILPPGPDSYYGPPGTGGGILPPRPGTGSGIHPTGPGVGILPPGPGTGAGILSPGPDSYYGPPGTGGGILPPGPGTGSGIYPTGPEVGILPPGPGTGAGILPPGPDGFYGPPGTGGGILPPGPGTGSGIHPTGPGAGILPPGPDSYYGPPGPGVGILPPGPGTGAGILPPGPDSYYGPPGTGGGILPPGPGTGSGIHPTGPGIGILPPGPGTGAGILPPGPDSYYGPPGPGTGGGILPPGPGTGSRIHPTGPGVGILPPGPGTGAGILPPGPDSYYGPPGTGGGILPPGPGTGILSPGPDSYYGPPGPGTGGGILPPGPGTGIHPPGPGTGAGILPPGPNRYNGPPGAGIFPPGPVTGSGIHSPGPGTGAGIHPPGPDSYYGPPGSGGGIHPHGSNTGAGILPPGPDNYYGPPG